MEDNNALNARIMAPIIKYNRQKREGQGISQNFKGKSATLFSMDSIVILPSLNINYTQRPLKGRKWKTTVFHFLKYSKTSCTISYNYCNSTCNK